MRKLGYFTSIFCLTMILACGSNENTEENSEQVKVEDKQNDEKQFTEQIQAKDSLVTEKSEIKKDLISNKETEKKEAPSEPTYPAGLIGKWDNGMEMGHEIMTFYETGKCSVYSDFEDKTYWHKWTANGNTIKIPGEYGTTKYKLNGKKLTDQNGQLWNKIK